MAKPLDGDAVKRITARLSSDPFLWCEVLGVPLGVIRGLVTGEDIRSMERDTGALNCATSMLGKLI